MFMFQRNAIRVLAISLAMAVVAVAQAEIIWTPTDLPENTTPWVRAGTDVYRWLVTDPAGDYMRIDTGITKTNLAYYKIVDNTSVLDMTQDHTIILTARVNSATPTNTFGQAVVGKVPGYYDGLALLTNSVYLFNGPDYYYVDTSQWHTYRIWWDYTNKQTKLWIDDVFAQTSNMIPLVHNLNGIDTWGDSRTSANGSVDYKFMGVYNGLVPEPSTMILLFGGIAALALYAWRRR